VAARVGFCGLDRRRQPLHGDEVRACWEDGAVPPPPDPVTPGLLDLLTVRALRDVDPDASPASQPGSTARRESPVPRLRSASTRDWVEVGVEVEA
jgi:hypothetical protein